MTTFGVQQPQPQQEEEQQRRQFEDYFSSTTTFSASKRLLESVSAVRRGYDVNEWNSLSEREQERIVDEAVIGARKKNENKKSPLPLGATQVYPRLKQPTGLKTLEQIHDLDGGSQGEDLDSASSSGCVSCLIFFYI